MFKKKTLTPESEVVVAAPVEAQAKPKGPAKKGDMVPAMDAKRAEVQDAKANVVRVGQELDALIAQHNRLPD